MTLVPKPWLRPCGCPGPMAPYHHPGFCTAGLGDLGEAEVTPYPWEIDRPQPVTWERVATILGVIGGAIGLAATVSALMKRRRKR